MTIDLSSDEISVFDTNADRYDEWFERRRDVYNSEVAAVRAALPDPVGRGVEIGIGTGRFAIPFGITEGVEPAAAMRRIAEARGLHPVAGVAEALPYADACFAFALMITTICFVNDPEKSIAEAQRILKPGGRLVIGLVDLNSPLGKTYEARRRQSPFYRFARFFTAEQVGEIMIMAGLGQLTFHQTIFRQPDAIDGIEPVLPGHGRGGFVCVTGTKCKIH